MASGEEERDEVRQLRELAAGVVRAVIAGTKGASDGDVKAEALGGLCDDIVAARRALDQFVKLNATYAPGTDVGFITDQLGRTTTLMQYTTEGICEKLRAMHAGTAGAAGELEALRARLSAEVKTVMELGPQAWP
jgi:hypothetical protein